jgi:hypothetical protein
MNTDSTAEARSADILVGSRNAGLPVGRAGRLENRRYTATHCISPVGHFCQTKPFMVWVISAFRVSALEKARG